MQNNLGQSRVSRDFRKPKQIRNCPHDAFPSSRPVTEFAHVTRGLCQRSSTEALWQIGVFESGGIDRLGGIDKKTYFV